MKRISILSLICILSLGWITSCDISETNPSGITDETVFSTPEGFESLVNAAYSYTRWWYGKEEGYAASEMGTDIWTSGAGDENTNFTQYVNLQSEARVVNVFWEHLYAVINLTNAGINRVGGSGLSQNMRTIREAELRFLRAFYYWHVVETWGGVHFTIEETRGIEVVANRTPVERFYEQIFEDLTFAVANLPVTTSDYGRVTKPAAEAFLARMYLTRGNNQQAYNLATGVINNYNFTLMSNYADLWDMSNIQNAEVVWAVNYSRELALNDRQNNILFPTGHGRGGHNGHLHFQMTYDQLPGMTRDIENGRPFNRYMPTRYLLDLFDESIDSRYEGSFKEVWYSNNPTSTIALGDTAVYMSKLALSPAFRAGKAYTIFDRNDIYNADGTTILRTRYPSLSKFLDPTRPTVAEQISSRDAFVIRLAEMYLIAAEAQMNMTNTTVAANYINEVRRRAAKPGHETDMEVAAGQITIDFILDERARELAGEQLRWFDLKRTGKLLDRVQAHNPEAAVNLRPHHIVRPIPQRQIDAVQNPAEFTQNPGYQ